MKVTDFDLKQTLECGQCFNFEEISSEGSNGSSSGKEEEYVVVAMGQMLHIRQIDDELEFLNASEADIRNIWIPYFDLGINYGKIKRAVIEADSRLAPIVGKYSGIRILNQEFGETLLSFIISQNKNIPQIKKIIRRMSEIYGSALGEVGGRKYYSFPSLQTLKNLSEHDFKDLGTGFRAPYLKAAVEFLTTEEAENDVKLNAASHLQSLSYDEAKKILTSIKGVGDKVANCALLFSLGFRNAFPVDVWIERIMREMYFSSEHETKLLGTKFPHASEKIHAETKISRKEIEEFAERKFGEYGGYAQQYLFIYAREGGILTS